MRSFDEERRILNLRAKWQCFDDFGEPGEVMYLLFIKKRVYVGKELPRCLIDEDVRVAAKHAVEWEKYWNLIKVQYDAKEPNRRKF